jgi:antitoxin (DNA-binding transcriptional repressor) of toxin-antitoxin stability system
VPVFTIKAARTALPKLVPRAEAGEEIVLARGSKPVARIVAIRAMQARPMCQFGRLKGKARIGPEFFDPLSEEELGPLGVRLEALERKPVAWAIIEWVDR